jgi:hypothetical protein
MWHVSQYLYTTSRPSLSRSMRSAGGKPVFGCKVTGRPDMTAVGGDDRVAGAAVKVEVEGRRSRGKHIANTQQKTERHELAQNQSEYAPPSLLLQAMGLGWRGKMPGSVKVAPAKLAVYNQTRHTHANTPINTSQSAARPSASCIAFIHRTTPDTSSHTERERCQHQTDEAHDHMDFECHEPKEQRHIALHTTHRTEPNQSAVSSNHSTKRYNICLQTHTQH